MHFAKVASAQVVGLDARHIDVEVDIARGLHSFSIVGLAAKAVEESRDRIGAALKNCGFKSPKHSNQKVTVSLAPAELKKEGAGFDLAIAVAYLAASGVVAADALKNTLFVGELSLDGSVRPIRGITAITAHAAQKGVGSVFIPIDNAQEAALETDTTIYPVSNLQQLIDHITGKSLITAQPPTKISLDGADVHTSTTFAHIVGQESAKRALTIAIAGGHSVALFGPPGTGKTMLAQAAQSLVPPLTESEIREVTSIHSVSPKGTQRIITTPPFRAPHHRTSAAALVGGGSVPQPGEITLAHRGILFLDEFPEFSRDVIEALRQPLEEKRITITRQKEHVTFPADCILIAALNPCPCGFTGHTTKQCTCTKNSIDRYNKKLSGPIVDRIDMWIEVPHVSSRTLIETRKKKSVADTEHGSLRTAITQARDKQKKRQRKLNGSLTSGEIKTLKISREAVTILTSATQTLDLSPRSIHKIIKLAQTIADLTDSNKIASEHVLEALQFRKK